MLLLTGIGPGVASGQYPTPTALDLELQAKQPGEIVNLGTADSYLYLNSGAAQLSFTPGTLVYSDDPETALDHGILYRSPVPAGNTRVYVYHVNGTGSPAKVTAAMQNAGTAPATIVFQRKSLRPPSTNFINVGKTAVRDFYENAAVPAQLTLQSGEAALLDTAMDGLVVSPGQLLSAKYDFTSDQPLTVTTLMLPASANTISSLASAPLATPDGKNRQGTFSHSGKETATPYSYSTSDNSRMIKIGDGDAYDSYVQGHDYEQVTAAVNRGNFGVTYTIKINVRSPDGKGVAVVLNPRGGSHAGYMRSSFPAGAAPIGHLLPSGSLNLADNTKAIICSRIVPSSAPQLLTLEYMPPGASSLPVNLMLFPYTAPAAIDTWELY